MLLPDAAEAAQPQRVGDDEEARECHCGSGDDRVEEAGDRKSRAGILIPATANVDRRLIWAEVVAAGPTVRTIEVGDRVLFSPDTGFEVEIRGEEYLILRETDVLAKKLN